MGLVSFARVKHAPVDLMLRQLLTSVLCLYDQWRVLTICVFTQLDAWQPRL